MHTIDVLHSLIMIFQCVVIQRVKSVMQQAPITLPSTLSLGLTQDKYRYLKKWQHLRSREFLRAIMEPYLLMDRQEVASPLPWKVLGLILNCQD